MNHETAAGLREELHTTGYVRTPHDGPESDKPFGMVRVNQPGYLNDRPHYEVRMYVYDDAIDTSLCFPSDLLELAVERNCYLRLEHGEPGTRREVVFRDGGGDD